MKYSYIVILLIFYNIGSVGKVGIICNISNICNIAIVNTRYIVYLRKVPEGFFEKIL